SSARYLNPHATSDIYALSLHDALPIYYVFTSDLSEEDNKRVMIDLVALPDRPSAIICFSDYVALDTMKVAKEKGLNINQDVSFISFSNFPIWNHIENKPMASIEQFAGKQAEKASDILFDLINKDQSIEKKLASYPSQVIHFESLCRIHDLFY